MSEWPSALGFTTKSTFDPSAASCLRTTARPSTAAATEALPAATSIADRELRGSNSTCRTAAATSRTLLEPTTWIAGRVQPVSCSTMWATKSSRSAGRGGDRSDIG